MKIVLSLISLAGLLTVAGCEVEAGYGGPVYGEYPYGYYGGYPVYVAPAPYDRDHYFDRHHYWDRHGYYRREGHWR